MALNALPTKVVAGVTIPDTPLLSEAFTFAREHSTDYTYNHINRALLLGCIIADKVPATKERDREAHAVAAVLHDLGFPIGHPPHSQVLSSDKRFEVDGADAARDFLRRVGVEKEWDKHRLQLVWDAIALHTIGSIVFHKEPEVQATAYGIWADFQGPDRVPGGLLTWEEYNAVVKVGFAISLRVSLITLSGCFQLSRYLASHYVVGVSSLRPDERRQREHAASLQDKAGDDNR